MLIDGRRRMSNAERQRLFQKRHPGYDKRRKARERAMLKRAERRSVQARRQAAAAARAEAAAADAPPQQLLLPAPVVDPAIVELNALAAQLAPAEKVAVSR